MSDLNFLVPFLDLDHGEIKFGKDSHLQWLNDSKDVGR